jgi:prevent-host-death family protein
MQTYSIESISAQLPLLLKKVANGEEILLTEKERPVARLVPANDQDDDRRMKALRGGLRGVDPTLERDENKSTYLERVRTLRGSLKGIDTDVEPEDDPA